MGFDAARRDFIFHRSHFVFHRFFITRADFTEPNKQTKQSKSRCDACILNSFGYAGSFVGGLLGAFSDFIFYIMLVLCAAWIAILARLDRI